MNEQKKTNRLINEKSPYLLQHAYNPVDWFPWGEEAFEKARKEDKPIFLSVGYSTCYWCHVMEREVFENEEIAKIMNRLFVNIKVDREERPDVDRVYMTALQAMTGSGGWPMSMFLTPGLKPFYGATYIPPSSKYGMTGFENVMAQIQGYWNEKRNDVLKSSDRIIDYIRELSLNEAPAGKLNHEMFQAGAQQFKGQFDAEYGGFGGAPKFPRPVSFNFLLREYRRSGDAEALEMVIRTLMQMEKGGVFDHIGGGFHRYSVDRFWRMPHFEKMLYDQAQIANSFIDAYLLTKDEYFSGVAKSILDYVLRKLTSPEGGFYSAEDAESSISHSSPEVKREGEFYAWEKAEVDTLLGEDSEMFCYYFGVLENGNAPVGSDPHDIFVNKNILYRANSVKAAAEKFGKPAAEIESAVVKGKQKLFEYREKRPKPYLDDKILVSWNGLMISAFARAYQASIGGVKRDSYLAAARDSANFIVTHLYKKDSKVLLHRYREGDARFESTLADYAFFIQGLVDLYETCFEIMYLETALEITLSMISLFYDKENGGFFDVSGTDTSILVKTKEDYDSAEPTGNSVAIMDLIRLSRYTRNDEMFGKAYRSLEQFSAKLSRHPFSMPQMLCALDCALSRPKHIIISGNPASPEVTAMIKEVHGRYISDRILIFACPGGAEDRLMPYLSSIITDRQRMAAYVCENYACKLPVSTAKELGKLLDS